MQGMDVPAQWSGVRIEIGRHELLSITFDRRGDLL